MNHQLDSISYLIEKYFGYRSNIWQTDKKTNKIFLMENVGSRYKLSIANRSTTDNMNDVEFRKCIELIRVIHYDSD